MSTFLPHDSNDQPIPALRLKNGAAHSITTSGISARNATAFQSSTRVVSIYATAGTYLRFGDSSVTASGTDHYFPASVYYDVAIGGDKTAHYTHLAALAADGNGTVYISEKE